MATDEKQSTCFYKHSRGYQHQMKSVKISYDALNAPDALLNNKLNLGSLSGRSDDPVERIIALRAPFLFGDDDQESVKSKGLSNKQRITQLLFSQEAMYVSDGAKCHLLVNRGLRFSSWRINCLMILLYSNRNWVVDSS